MKSLQSPDKGVDVLQIGKHLSPRRVFNGLKNTLGESVLCVQTEEWREGIKSLKEAGHITTDGINWYVQGWSERIHLVNKAGRLATVEALDSRFSIITPTNWAHTNRVKSRLVQRSGSSDGEDYIFQELPGVPEDHFPVREFRPTTTISQPELGLLTASRLIGKRILTAESGMKLLLAELWAIKHEALGYQYAGYNGEKLYQDDSMPAFITAALLSSFAESP